MLRLAAGFLRQPVQRAVVRAMYPRVSPATLISRRSFNTETLKVWHAKLREQINPTYIIHFGNCMAVIALGMNDMLYLRTFLLMASVCGIAFNLLQPVPIISAATWGLFFVCGHSLQIILLLREGQKVALDEDEEKLYETSFMPYGFTPRHFKKLMTSGQAKWVTVKKGTFLAGAGTPKSHVWCLVKGRIATLRDGLMIAETTPGQGSWLGDLYDPNEPPQTAMEEEQREELWHVAYEAVEDALVVELERAGLRACIGANPRMKMAATAFEVADLSQKLYRIEEQNPIQIYSAMMTIALKDGKINREEREMLHTFRELHHISDEHHHRALAKSDWTEEDFQNGRKHTPGRISRWWRAVSGKGSTTGSTAGSTAPTSEPLASVSPDVSTTTSPADVPTDASTLASTDGSVDGFVDGSAPADPSAAPIETPAEVV